MITLNFLITSLIVGWAADAAYAIQRALPGQPMQQLPLALVSDFLALNAYQAGQARSEVMNWPDPVVHLVLFGGDGFCLLEPMQTYSTTSARMLQDVQSIVRRYVGEIAPQADIVHYDCNPANVLAATTGITINVVETEAVGLVKLPALLVLICSVGFCSCRGCIKRSLHSEPSKQCDNLDNRYRSWMAEREFRRR
jgi:hypothetical protein